MSNTDIKAGDAGAIGGRIKSVCVYCGSSSKVDQQYKDVAHEVGTMLAGNDLVTVYGGGRVGLMGIVADAALSAGGDVIGIIPEHILVKEVQHTKLTELLVVDSMHTRKRLMVNRSDAFVILPGGLGTLDETFEILTWKQLKLHDKPVILVNIDGYWQPLLDMMDNIIHEGFAHPDHRNLYTVVDSIDMLIPALEMEPASIVEPDLKWM